MKGVAFFPHISQGFESVFSLNTVAATCQAAFSFRRTPEVRAGGVLSPILVRVLKAFLV